MLGFARGRVDQELFLLEVWDGGVEGMKGGTGFSD